MRRTILAAILTPFRSDGALWLERIPPYLDFLEAHGVDGWLVLGTNGEFSSLDVHERERVLEATVDATSHQRVVVNVSGTVDHEVLRLARHAHDLQVDGVALMPPYYLPQSAASFEALARRVADAFGRPIHLYNIPRYAGFAIPVPTVAALARDGVVAGLKDSSQDLEYMGEVRTASPAIECLVGSDTVLLDGLDRGAHGVASGMANTFPDVAVGAVRAFEARGDVAPWATLIRRIREFFGNHPYLAATRHAIAARGVELGPVRAPLVDLDPGQQAAAQAFTAAVLDELSELEGVT